MALFRKHETTAQVPTVALPEARPAGQTVTSDVLVPALQNALGGIGAAVVVERCLWLAEFARADINTWALSIGMLVFGLATAIRAFRDEVVICIHAYAERRNRADYAELLAQRDELHRQLALANDEISRLQARDTGTADGRIHQLTMDLLWGYYERGEKMTWAEVSARNKLDSGVKISREVWEIITGFLRAAGVIDGNGGVKVHNFAEAWGAFLRVHLQATTRRIVAGKLVKVPK